MLDAVSADVHFLMRKTRLITAELKLGGNIVMVPPIVMDRIGQPIRRAVTIPGDHSAQGAHGAQGARRIVTSPEIIIPIGPPGKAPKAPENFSPVQKIRIGN